MKKNKNNYLRAQRLKLGLTQQDVTFLLGLKCHEKLSRVEMRKKLPTTDVVIACCLIFSVSIEELIPKEVKKIEASVMVRANNLYCRLLAQKKTVEQKQRLKIIKRIMDRSTKQLT